MTTPNPREVIIYKIDSNNRRPFNEWFNELRDPKGRRRVIGSVRKMEQGVYEHCRMIREGVRELKIVYGPGYRVYFGEHGNKIVILLGGDKGSQERDIQKAIDYWRDYKFRENL